MSEWPMQSRTVVPRHTRYRHYPLIVVYRGTFAYENGAGHWEYGWSIDDLPLVLLTRRSSIIVSHRMGALVRDLDKHLGDVSTWDVRVTHLNRTIPGPDGQPYSRTKILVSRFGFKRGSGRDMAVWFSPLDPEDFAPTCAFESLEALQRWAIDVREWLKENDIAPRSSAGGLAAQLLRDKRFYSKPRRKVPAATNARAVLRGNHYDLRGTTHLSYPTAYVLDMKNAHHHIVQRLALPDSNNLIARGHFHDPERDTIWAPPGSTSFIRTIQQFGMLQARVTLPVDIAPHLPAGKDYVVTIYTNELSRIWLAGGKLEGIIAAWTSPTRDTGLAKFATWSIEQLATADPYRKEWLKRTLHSVYGSLATRAQIRRVSYRVRHSRRARLAAVPLDGPRVLYLWRTDSTRMVEPGTTHAIQRGMIEVEQMHRALEMAFIMRANHVIAVYADAIIVSHEPTEPIDGWRVKERLTNLRFYHPTHFESRELTKRPGIPVMMR